MRKSLVLLASLMLISLGTLASEAPSAEKKGTYYGAKPTEYPGWFKDSFLDIREDIKEAASNKKRLLLFFSQNGCPYCNQMIERNFSQRDIFDSLQKHFDVVQINMWGDREVTNVDGRKYTEKDFAVALKVQFTPTMMFFDEDGRTILRLNGYLPPERFKGALDWVSGREEKKTSYRDFIAARESVTGASGPLIGEDFFLAKTSDLRRKGKNAKPLAVFFEQPDCPDCATLHRRVLADPELRSIIANFDNAQFDMWSNTPVITPDGKRTSVRDWARKLGVQYAPGIVLFDSKGKEIIRWESSFHVFHTAGMFDYILSGQYRKEPSFQRYLAGRAEHIRESGRDVNIWRYADEPVSSPGR